MIPNTYHGPQMRATQVTLVLLLQKWVGNM